MTWHRWIVFVVMEIVGSAVPGPAVLLIISQGLRYGGRRSLWGLVGILSVNALYFVLSAFSLTALLSASHQVFVVIKWLGAGYLIYLGASAVFGRHSTIASALEGTDRRPEANPLSLAGRGALLQATNPKMLLFFTALLPQFVNPSSPIGPQMVILGLSSIAVELPVLAAYGMLAGRAAHLARDERYARGADRVAGLLLMAVGAGVALSGDR